MTAALLVMDFQRGIVASHGDDHVLAHAVEAVTAARVHGLPVLFVRVAFRPGAPEIAVTNRVFGSAAARMKQQPEEATTIHDAFALHPDDIVVTKRRVSAFAGSDLEVLLRGLGVRQLVLAGISTSGVVLSTVRQAADLDFELTVLADACADRDPEVHRVLTEKVFPRQADVTTVADWTASLA